ncbi:MAG: polyprenyl synthetase family protein [Planctomycetota bacterium]
MSSVETDVVEASAGVIEAVEGYLAEWLGRRGLGSVEGTLGEAVGYGLLGGGKRVRPVLCVRCCEAVGGAMEAALPAAAAVELVHAFSLVHDDLPAMDDDDLRRGRPTLHVHAGEAMAILAGDAMQSLAFEVLVDEARGPGVPPPGFRDEGGADAGGVAVHLVRELAGATTGMVVGQVYDTLGDVEGVAAGLSDRERLERVHRNKTGALLRAACRMGAISGGAGDDELMAVTRYAEAIGLMFQVVDDLLDVEGTAASAGKATGKDAAAGKLTYPGVWGVGGSRAEVARLEAEALGALTGFGGEAEALRAWCGWLARREQ